MTVSTCSLLNASRFLTRPSNRRTCDSSSVYIILL